MRPKELTPQQHYLEKTLPSLDPWETLCRQASNQLNLGGISLGKSEAHFLKWCVELSQAKKALEIGTLTGLSGIYILDGLLPEGSLWTLEKNSEHMKYAEPILQQFATNCGKHVHPLLGDARETLAIAEKEAPFDFIFIDGNKAAYLDYLLWSEKNIKPGGYLLADNVFLSGAVSDQESTVIEQKFSKKQIQVMRDFNQRLLESDQWRACFVPTSEGFMLAQKI
jgi:predicted O-methyltransferase YrrM